MSEQIPTEPEQPGLLPAASPEATLPPSWAPQPPPPAPHNPIWNRIAAFIVLIAVVAAAAGAGIGWSIARAVNGSPVAQSSAAPSEAPIQAVTPGAGSSSGSSNESAIAARVSPAIVDINTTVGNSQAAGTGMIISSTGEILTNNHVVASSTSISITVQGRSQTYTAHVVGVDSSQDVALIQIDQSVSGLPTVKFATSASVKVGDSVIAIGNALGRGGAPSSSGTVTDLNQTITASEGGGQSETLGGMIQIDALIYQGDSGGALVNSSGQVVGMITAGQASGFRSQASNVSYAIASDTFLPIVNRIRAHEQASDLTYGQVGYMGVQVQNLDAATAAQLGLSVSSGALVVADVSGSPAATAGITRGSVITKLGGTTIDSADALGPAIRSHHPGDQVSVTWVDSSGTHTATVTLAGVNP